MVVPNKLAVGAFDHAGLLCKEVTMSETNSANGLLLAPRRPAELRISIAACGILALAAATWVGSALAQQKEKIPDFSLDNKSAWLMISDNLLPPTVVLAR
jgi:hypothetical protein